MSTGNIIKKSTIESSVSAVDEKGMKKVSTKLISDIFDFLKKAKA